CSAVRGTNASTAEQVRFDEYLRHRPRAGQDGVCTGDDGLVSAGAGAATLRVLVKRRLRQYGYPPKSREKATREVACAGGAVGQGVGGVRAWGDEVRRRSPEVLSGIFQEGASAGPLSLLC